MATSNAPKLSLGVHTFRNAGMEAKWGRARGAPCIFVRDPQSKHRHQREQWWLVDAAMWDRIIVEGPREGFNSCTVLGDYFSVPVRA